MANKNLIKRAFSVTANLATPRSDGAALSATPEPVVADVPPPAQDVSPPRTVEAADSPTAPAIGHRVASTPRTSPGSMMAFMAEQSEVHKEVVQLRQQLESYDGAEIARRLDPKEITVSKWANRHRAHFATVAFSQLKSEIDSAGGNVQPIKVRVLHGSAPGAPRFEVVYGHRRHQACLELGLPVLALVADDMKDAQLFVEMDRENREREDLSPWEQGVMYTRALDEGLFPSAKQLSAALGVDMGTVSKARTLSSLPEEVLSAFASPLELQFRWGKPLTDALQKDPEGMLARARSIAEEVPRRSSAEVFKFLTATKGATTVREGAAQWIDTSGRNVASMSTDRRGRATVVLEALDPAQQRRLVKVLDSFLGLKGEVPRT